MSLGRIRCFVCRALVLPQHTKLIELATTGISPDQETVCVNCYRIISRNDVVLEGIAKEVEIAEYAKGESSQERIPDECAGGQGVIQEVYDSIALDEQPKESRTT